MDRQRLLEHVCAALSAITAPRYFMSERGFQGALQVQLDRVLPPSELPTGMLIEQEYQKRLLSHGLTIRPDIIIHRPYEMGMTVDRRDGNLAVIELKRRADAEAARDDFKSLLAMQEILEYPLGIFINIDAKETYQDLVPAEAEGRIACISVWLDDSTTHITRG